MLNLSEGKAATEGLQFMDGTNFPSASASTPGPPPDTAAFQGPPPSATASALTPSFLKTARHPIVCIFHLLFKLLAFLCFLFGSFIFGGWQGDYVFTFVVTTLLLSFDFWTVKNVTGRMLVGMRWWNNIKDDGSNEWIFESRTNEGNINATDKTVFWTGVYVWPIVWVVLFIVYLLRFEIQWMLLVTVAMSLSLANLVGYWKCSKDSKRKMQEWAQSTAFKAILGRMGM
eukprot:Polyplicarium_translucidae@DN2011_c0_g1_i1.p1